MLSSKQLEVLLIKKTIARLEQTIAKLQESQDEGDAKLTATGSI